jgi:hypothetical protein
VIDLVASDVTRSNSGSSQQRYAKLQQRNGELCVRHWVDD